MNEQEQNINENYKEIADCYDVDLQGFFLLDEDGKAKWIDLSGVM